MRYLLLALGLLCGPPLALAAPPEPSNLWLFWDYPVALQGRVTFEGTLAYAVGGQATQQVQPLVPVSKADCQEATATNGEAWSDETLCAAVCAPVGELTWTVRARRGTQVSFPSNEAHPILTKPCAPPQPPPLPPPSSSPGVALPATAIGIGAVVVTGAVANPGSSPSLPELVNRNCVEWRITGPCFCNPFTPCLQVEYHEPAWLIETVKAPGTTALPILGELLKAGLAALGVSRFGGGGSGNSAGAGMTNLAYSEAHVWSFPQIFGGPCSLCAPVDALPVLQYASEADTASWRLSTGPIGLPALLYRPVGAWGPLFPRVGFIQQGSPPLASALLAFRAMHIGFQPVSPPPLPEAHVVIGPSLGLSGCLQMASPKQTPCIPVGLPGTVWEHGAVSPHGAYIWIGWRKRSCCVPPNATTCGITLPPLAGSGENMCPL